MTLVSIIVEWIGTPNNFVGDIIVITLAAASFFWLLEGLMYSIWRFSTGRFG